METGSRKYRSTSQRRQSALSKRAEKSRAVLVSTPDWLTTINDPQIFPCFPEKFSTFFRKRQFIKTPRISHRLSSKTILNKGFKTQGNKPW